MTPREREIMALLRKNPQISQREIAEKLNITRSGVSTHINNLAKNGYILGRTYILREDDYISVVGGANMDIVGSSYNKIIRKDSNPGYIKYSSGGVGRNICADLARLGIKTSFISVLGTDTSGSFIKNELSSINVDTSNILIVSGSTPHYLAILDDSKDMELAISDMDLVKKIDKDFLQGKRHIISSSKLTILDTNLEEEALGYLFKNIPSKYLVDGVSTKKVVKLKNYLPYIFFLKVNEYEAKALTDEKDDIEKIAEELLDKGLNSLCITLGSKGAYYFSKKEKIFKKSIKLNVVNASGAGDAFMAGFSYGLFNDESVEECLNLAMASSRIVLKSKTASPYDYNLEKLMEEVKNAW